MSTGQNFYSEEEADEILRIAARDTAGAGAMDRTKLIETAAELGIPVEAVQRAESEILARREEFNEAQKEARDRTAYRAYRKSKLWTNLGSYLGTNAMMVGIWYMTGHGYFWPGWMLAFWSIDLVNDLGKVAFPGMYEESFQKWRRKRADAKRVLTAGQGPEIEAALADYIDEERKAKRDKVILDLQARFALGKAEATAVVDDFDERNGHVFEH